MFDLLLADQVSSRCRDIQLSLEELTHHINVYEVMKTHGYSDDLIAAAGGAKFLNSLYIGEHEWVGKSRIAKQSVCMANLFTWIKDTSKIIWNKVIEFINWLAQKFGELIHKQNSKIVGQKVSKLASVSTFPSGMQVPDVYNYDDLLKNITDLRGIIQYLNTCYREILDVFCDAVDHQNLYKGPVPWDFGNHILETMKQHGLFAADINGNLATGFNPNPSISADTEVRAFYDTIRQEITSRHLFNTIYISPNVNNSDPFKVIRLVSSTEPVDPTEFGWRGGSQLKFFNTTIDTVYKEIHEFYDILAGTGHGKNIKDKLTILKGKTDDVHNNNVLQLLIRETNILCSISAQIYGAIVEYQGKFNGMCEFILEQIRKSKR